MHVAEPGYLNEGSVIQSKILMFAMESSLPTELSSNPTNQHV